MELTRCIGVPYEHVTAEMAAFPLASEAALRWGATSLDPMMNAAMPSLWRDAERELIGQFPGFLVDEIVAIRDRVWFQRPQSQCQPRGDSVDRSLDVSPLHEYLPRLARELLESNGWTAVPKLLDGDSPDGRLTAAVLAKRRRTWRWLTFALPSDLLLAALGDGDGGPDTVETLSPAIQNMLRDRGFAETHLHVGAGFDFPTLWLAVQHAAAHERFKSDSLKSPGAGFSEGVELAPWLVRALLARHLLGAYLGSAGSAGSFQDYLTTTVHDRVGASYLPGGFSTIVGALADLRCGRLSDGGATFADLQAAYGLVSGVKTASGPETFERRDEADSLFDFFPPPLNGRPTTEVRLVRKSLAYLKSTEKRGKPDALFASLFWQVVRVRNLFYRHVTQRPLTPGLLWFIRFYGRIGEARKPLSFQFQIESASRLNGRGKGLRSLEIRTSPSASTAEILGTFEQAAASWMKWRKQAKEEGRPQDECELGVILHFTKARGGEAQPGVPRAFWRTSNADPGTDDNRSGNPLGFRYAGFQAKKMAEARALAWVLKTYPLTAQLLRGLDLCTDEMGVPNWVFAPVLKHVRDAAGAAAAMLRGRSRIDKPIDLPPLRTTIHAGEDFVHLQSGLRCVAEAIDQLGLREGDRIGHGVSLGIDPRDWARQHGRLAMNLEDRLLDLVWEWSWHGGRNGSRIAARQHVLEREIAELSERLFGTVVAPFELERLRQDLCCLIQMRQIGYGELRFVERTKRDVDPRRWLLEQYLTSRALFDRGRQLIWVDVAREEESLAHLQAELRERVGSLGIVVEVNPTSNLLIGNLDDLTRHPMWRLRPPRPRPDDPPPVGVCIGSDDPLTFNSNLRQEYQCLADAMTLAGLSDDEAAQWLERTRVCGLEHRFTLDQLVLDECVERPLLELTNWDL